jgi:hypothetical protein
VLSTSKNAAAVGSAGTVRAASTSAAAQPAAVVISRLRGSDRDRRQERFVLAGS